MDLTFPQSIIIGFISGMAELLPVSAEAHRSILRHLMGITAEDPVFRLFIHIFTLAAVFWCCREDIYALRRTQALLRIPARRRRHQPDMPSVYTLRLLRNSAAILLLGRFFTLQAAFIADKLHILAIVLVLNGILVLLPRLLRSANKDSRNMPRSDSFVMGLAAALSVIPGFSLVGCTTAAGISRGVDRKYALKFAYLLLIPGLVLHIIFDVAALFLGSAVIGSVGIAAALIGGIAAFAGVVIAYRITNFLIYGSNLSPFSYYCFGAGLFAFLLFLMI